MFGDVLKKERKKLNLTQEQLAKKINTTRQNITNWETGYNVPSIDLLQRLSNFFDCSIDYLLGRNSYRNLKEYYLNHKVQFDNDMKVLNAIDNKTFNDLDLDVVYGIDEKDIDNSDINLPKPNSEIFLDKLKEMNLLSNDKELSNEELKIILEFIENNKNMLKNLMNKDE